MLGDTTILFTRHQPVVMTVRTTRKEKFGYCRVSKRSRHSEGGGCYNNSTPHARFTSNIDCSSSVRRRVKVLPILTHGVDRSIDHPAQGNPYNTRPLL